MRFHYHTPIWVYIIAIAVLGTMYGVRELWFLSEIKEIKNTIVELEEKVNVCESNHKNTFNREP
jgi:hypothetical protein